MAKKRSKKQAKKQNKKQARGLFVFFIVAVLLLLASVIAIKNQQTLGSSATVRGCFRNYDCPQGSRCVGAVIKKGRNVRTGQCKRLGGGGSSCIPARAGYSARIGQNQPCFSGGTYKGNCAAGLRCCGDNDASFCIR